MAQRSDASAGTTDEAAVIFDTAAYLDEARKEWVVPLHGWVYRAQDSTVRKGAVAALLQRQYGLAVTADSSAIFDRRVNLLLADNKRGRTLKATVAGQSVTLPPTRANGHIELTLRVPVSGQAPIEGGFASIVTEGADQTSRAHLISPEGVSIISDIDDTVKVSGVLDKKQLWRSTFYEPFQAVPGMADLMRRVGGGNAAVHYVSSSPWHLYAPLREWLLAEKFPLSALHLKQIRLKDSTILDIAKSPVTTKPPMIAEILQRYPKRTFILLGDSGEKDPEVYGAAARQFGPQIKRILIRRAPGDRTSAARFEAAFKGLDRAVWELFDDPSKVV